MNTVFSGWSKGLESKNQPCFSVLSMSLFFFFLFLLPVSSQAQPKKKPAKDPGYRTLNTAVPKSEIKLKKFDEYQEFVIVDDRGVALEDIVQEEESGTMQEVWQQKLPINTVFKTTASKVCVIGVDGTANAKMILALVNNKKVKVIKKADLEKALSIINVKLITKE